MESRFENVTNDQVIARCREYREILFRLEEQMAFIVSELLLHEEEAINRNLKQ